jgi:regulatory protein
LDRLGELGYLDDEAFARSWVESRDRARPRGEHALKRELQLKGVDRALIDAVLDDRREHGASSAGQDDQPASPDDVAAERLLRKKLPAILRETDLRKRKQRAYALLARNGFGPDVCSAVSKRVLDVDAAAGDEDDDERDRGP